MCFLVTLTLLIYIQYVTSTEFFTGLTRKFLASGVNSLLYGFVIMVLELGLFRHISGLLSEFENWQLQSEYESAYVFKVQSCDKKCGILSSRRVDVVVMPHSLCPLTWHTGLFLYLH